MNNINPYIFHYNTDEKGNPTAIYIENESNQVSPNLFRVQLSQIPKKGNGLVVLNDKKEELQEVNSRNKITPTSYYVDYNSGVVYFDTSNAGKTFLYSFYGTGYELVSCERIYDAHNPNGQYVITTLQEIIDKGRECIEALSTVGNAVEVLHRLEQDIETGSILHTDLLSDINIGKTLHTNLTNDISTGTTLHTNLTNKINTGTTLNTDLGAKITTGTTLKNDLATKITEGNTIKDNLDIANAEAEQNISAIQSTGNGTWTIPSTSWVGTAPDLTCVINHNMNSKNLIVAVVDTTTQKSIMSDYTIVDMNNIEMQSIEASNITVTINAKYYSGKDANIIAQEVQDARGIETNLKARLDKSDAQLADIAKPIVAFTFDDGYIEDNLTYSILKEYGYVGSFGLITNELYKTSKNSLYNYKQYEKEGFEILSHSATHVSLTSGGTSDDIKFREMRSSADKLRGLGFMANGFVVPYSNISSNNITYAKNIYDYILIGGTGLNDKNGFKNKTLTRVSQYNSGVATTKALIDQAISEKKLLIFYDHRIGNTGALSETEFREILTYLKTKTDANLIEVHNVKNAVSKYYGIEVGNDKPIRSYDNMLPPLNSATWTLTDSATGATVALSTSYIEPVQEITIPASASIGTSLTFNNTYTLESSMDNLGEKVDLHCMVKMSNSQYTYFNKFVDIQFLDSSDNVLISKTNQIYPNNTDAELLKFEFFNDVGVDITNVKKIKVSFRFEIVTSPTVAQVIRIMSAKLIFPNSNFSKSNKIDEGFSAKLMTTAQTITQNIFTPIIFDNVVYNDNLSYNQATGEFTVKQSGTYLINATIRWASMVSGTRLVVAAFVGSTQNLSTESRGNGTSTQTTSLSTIIKLTKGNKLTIRAFQDSAGTLDIGVGNYTWANVNLLK